MHTCAYTQQPSGGGSDNGQTWGKGVLYSWGEGVLYSWGVGVLYSWGEGVL